eukprot:m.282432 g.282432  ORF g.282432 m.282432 type:complete len:124 (+) comp40653_c0_seq7:893-1264(+)
MSQWLSIFWQVEIDLHRERHWNRDPPQCNKKVVCFPNCDVDISKLVQRGSVDVMSNLLMHSDLLRTELHRMWTECFKTVHLRARRNEILYAVCDRSIIQLHGTIEVQSSAFTQHWCECPKVTN